MTRSGCREERTMIICKHTPLPSLLLLIIILPFVLFGCQALVNLEYYHQKEAESMENSISAMFEKDPVLSLLGKSFLEIRQVLGEPDEQGYSDWLGPHHYILYRYEEGFIQFCSPELIKNEIAVSIILGPGQEVLGARVGMRFPEIAGILGSPDFGPEIGMDNFYYVDYFWEEINDQIQKVFISFIAVNTDSPTDHVFIKWESFQYEETKIFQAAR
jgi:hypothetical protein